MSMHIPEYMFKETMFSSLNPLLKSFTETSDELKPIFLKSTLMFINFARKIITDS